MDPKRLGFYQENPVNTLKAGSIGTINTLGLAKVKKAEYLLASTSEIYGDPEVSPQSEEYWGNVNPIGIRSCYDEGKRCAETLFFDYHREKKLKIKVVRIFNTYGPNMQVNDGRVVSNFIVQAINNKPITIYGDGKHTRSFCYVDDLILGMYKCMQKNKSFKTPVYKRNQLVRGQTIRGPAIIEQMDSTAIIFPKDIGKIDNWGNLIISTKG